MGSEGAGDSTAEFDHDPFRPEALPLSVHSNEERAFMEFEEVDAKKCLIQMPPLADFPGLLVI